ncbi:MAG: efflux RND transporter periplasmic adaptor subunit [Thiobacillus sp.]|nr:efflux RND transporter periplasmic adaptor subunit [Thiobacillus sp.]
MGTESKAAVPASAWLWLAGLCTGAALVAMPLLVAGHSDPRMFGQNAKAADAPAAGGSEVRLPAGVMGREQSLFGLARAEAGSQTPTLQTYGLVVPNSQAMVDLNLPVSGQVKEVYVRVGDSVRKGQPVAAIFNPEFITTQRGYLEFLKNEDKLQVLREEGRLPNYLKDAKENLGWWGMSEKQIADLIEHGKVVEHIMLDAPADGFITELFVQPGSLVNAGDRTMKQFLVIGKAVARMVAARTPHWVEGYVYPDQRALLRPGLPVRLSLPDGWQLERRIIQVLPDVEPATQRARFLVDLGQTPVPLAVGQTVDIGLRLGERNGVWVPREAVLAQALRPVVYVRLEPGRYRRTPVAVLDESSALLRVQGVAAGENVVVAGKMMLEGFYRIAAGSGADAADHHHDH